MAGGKSETLFSGYKTTNSLVYRQVEVLGYGETNVVPHCVTGGATSFTIRGYPCLFGGGVIISGTSISLVSGSVGSGCMAQYCVSDAYEVLDIGVASNAANTTGTVNIYVSRKRRQ